MTWLAAWWRRGDQFDWLSGYLATRKLRTLIRCVMAASTVTLSAITLAMTWSPAGPHRVFGIVPARLAVVWCFLMAALWMWRWPSRRLSHAYAVSVVACTAMVCISYADPLFGLIGCMTFGVVGGYIAFFHTARLLVFNLALAAATTLALTIRLANSSGDIIASACAFLVVAVAVVAVPFASQALVYSLGRDVMDSDVDPLCGLLNRRAFYRAAGDLIATRRGEQELQFNALMVDLDDFKSVNDSRGHAVGDRALIAVADILRRNTDEDALAARVGGEEFLVLETGSGKRAAVHAEQVRQAIAAAPYNITASVGIASITLERASAPLREVIDKLVNTADAAMYDAKRAGGNRTRQRFAATSID